MNKEYSNKKTYFGFNLIEEEKKVLLVNNVFNTVAKKYDLMNDIMSFGIHRIWKHILIQYSGVYNGSNVLDLAGGTGDISKLFYKKVGKKGTVVLVDINDSMLKIGRNKFRNKGMIKNIIYIQADAEKLPFPDNTFNCISLSFGLRNITNKEKALSSIYRVLKPGGRILILEFYIPKYNIIKKFYDLYSFHILPKLGKIIVGDSYSYNYLVESIRTHPNQEQIRSMMLASGMNNVEYFNISGGIVALHRGYKF